MASSKYTYKHGSSTVGAAGGRIGNIDDFLTTKDTATSSRSAKSARGTGSVRSQENTANRIHLSSKQGTTSTRQRNNNYKDRVSPVSKTIVTDERLAPLASPESNGRTSPGVDRTDDDKAKLISLLSGLQKLDVERILSTTATSTRTQELLDNLQSELVKVKQEYEALREAYDSNIQQTQEFQDKNEQLLTKAKQMIKEAKEKAATEADEKVQNLKRQLLEKDVEIRQMKSDKDSALSRLSKEMGEKLNDNNAGIADLSDPNRSTKVAEKYNNLYDNDWTDALEELQNAGLDEETGVRFLLEIIKHIYSFCQNAKTEQIENIKRLLDNPLSSVSRHDSSPTTEKTDDKNVKHMLESCVKMRTKTTIHNLQKEYSKIGSASKPRYADRLPDYTNNCIEICWLMNTHSPPLVFADPVASGQSYDKDLYREFTKQGDVVSFVVWLPMLIEAGGALLSKGVVQPIPVLRSEQKQQKYGRPGSAKTKPDPRYAWQNDTDNTQGSIRETHDEQLRKVLNDPIKQDYEKNFESLQDFSSKNTQETDINYRGSHTYTKRPEQQINEIFQDNSGSRIGYQSSYGVDVLSTQPSKNQYGNKYNADTGPTQSKFKSDYDTDKYHSGYTTGSSRVANAAGLSEYDTARHKETRGSRPVTAPVKSHFDNDNYLTSYTTERSRPTISTGDQDRYASKAAYGHAVGYERKRTEPNEDEVFRSQGITYALINNQLHVLHGTEWRPTTNFKY